MRRNFTAFAEQASAQTGQPVLELERVHSDGRAVSLDDDIVQRVDTLIVISFDSILNESGGECRDELRAAIRGFLAKPGNLLFVSPHHDIGNAENLFHVDRLQLQGTGLSPPRGPTIPPQQRASRLRALAACRAWSSGGESVWATAGVRARWIADGDRN